MLLKRISCVVFGCCLAVQVLAQQQPQVLDFTIKNGTATISASLHMPAQQDIAVPVVLVVPGSDRGTREYFLPYVPAINGLGYAVALYDKQGVGKSTGSFIQVSSANSTTTIVERAEIVSQLVRHLQKMEAVAPSKIGLLTSSQGAWVGAEVHQKLGGLAFILNYSGGVASVGVSDFYDEMMDDETITVAEGNARVEKFNGLQGYDPLSSIKTMDIPTLWIYGELDRSHPILYDLKKLEEMGKQNFTLKLLKNMTHDLIDVTTENISQEMIETSMQWLSSLELVD